LCQCELDRATWWCVAQHESVTLNRAMAGEFQAPCIFFRQSFIEARPQGHARED
jgi:hypothetical protein